MADGIPPDGSPHVPPGEDRAELLARLTTPAGLCARCRHLRLLASPRTVFVRCGRANTDPRFPRYPGLPVGSCRGFEE